MRPPILLVFSLAFLTTGLSAQPDPRHPELGAILQGLVEYTGSARDSSAILDGCSVFRALGRPGDFEEIISARLRPAIDEVSDPCGVSRHPAASVNRVFLNQLVVGDSIATASLGRWRSDYHFREEVTLLRPISGNWYAVHIERGGGIFFSVRPAVPPDDAYLRVIEAVIPFLPKGPVRVDRRMALSLDVTFPGPDHLWDPGPDYQTPMAEAASGLDLALGNFGEVLACEISSGRIAGGMFEEAAEAEAVDCTRPEVGVFTLLISGSSATSLNEYRVRVRGVGVDGVGVWDVSLSAEGLVLDVRPLFYIRHQRTPRPR